MPATSEVVHFGPAIIVQGDTELEVICRVTVTQRVLESPSPDGRAPRSRWAGEFSATSGRIDAAPNAPTVLRLPDGEYEIALTDVTVDPSGVTLGEFFGRGNSPSE
jgi:hypothetical protein